ncbi:MAG: DUF11 domain-containing protein [Bacteroidota bacterium]
MKNKLLRTALIGSWRCLKQLRMLLTVVLLLVIHFGLQAQPLVRPDFVSATPGSGSSATITMPSGSEVGDVVIVYIVTDDDGTITAPGDFIQVANFFHDTVGGPLTGLFYRVITGGELPTYTFSFPSEPYVAVVLRYKNLDPVSPFMAQNTSTGDSNTQVAPSVTTTRNNVTYLQFIGIDGASAGVLTPSSGTATVEVAAESGSGGGNAEMIMVSEQQATAGATPAGIFTFGATDEFTAITLALNAYSIETTGTTGTSCPVGQSSMSVSYIFGSASGTLELVDPSGAVLTTTPYSSAIGTATLNFTTTTTGTYTVRDQATPSLRTTAVFTVDDTDNDTVCDDIDLDDDNDGILDTEEVALCTTVDYNTDAKRQSIILSATAMTDGTSANDLSVLLDGDLDDQNFFYPDEPIAGLELLRMQFPAPTALSGLEYFIGDSYMLNTGASTKIQASNDGVSWIDVSPTYTKVRPPDNTPGVISNGDHTETFLWDNTTLYTYYRHIGVGGNANQNPWVYEVYFRTETPDICDQDGDGIANDKDLDSDNDGIPDNVEGQATLTYTAPANDAPATYVSNNGVNSNYLGGLPAPDTDGDACPDFLDINSDNDQILDQQESGLTFNGIPGANGLDSGSETVDDYTDVNGIVDDPPNNLPSSNPGVSEAFYREVPPLERTIKVCYKSDVAGSNTQVMEGTQRTFADDKLLNPANFSLSGTSTFTFELFDFGSNTVTLAELNSQGCQIFDAGIGGNESSNVMSSNSYTEAEENDLVTWTSASPSNVILAFEGYSIRFGGSGFVTSGSMNDNPNSLTPLGEQVLNGPFGNVASFNQAGTTQGTFVSFPSTACAVVQDADGDATGVLNTVTGDVYLADAGLIGENGGLTNSANITSNTDIFYANLYHSLARLVVFTPSNACNFFGCPAGDDAPVLSATSITGNGSVDLTTITASNLPTTPTASILTWHTGLPATNANRIGNPTAYTISGNVFAAIYNPNEDCYAGDGVPGTLVNVTVNAVVSAADLSVSIAPPTLAGNAGEFLTYTVTLSNAGPQDATNVDVQVPIPNGTATLVTHTAASGTYNPITNLWTVPSLLNGGSTTLTFTLQVD